MSLAQAILMSADIRSVYELLRLKPIQPKIDDAGALGILSKHEAPQNLPTPDVEKNEHIEEAVFSEKSKPNNDSPAHFVPTYEPAKKPVRNENWLNMDLVKYPLIFVLAFGFFYVFLNFGAISDKYNVYFKPAPKASPEPQKIEGRILGASTPEYNAWIGKYFYQVNNLDVVGPNVDFDKDGLSNYQEFLLRTNPTRVDTDADGYRDGREILEGYDPLRGEHRLFTDDEKEIVKDWDMQEISNRIAYNALSNLQQGPQDPEKATAAAMPAPSVAPAIDYNLDTAGEVVIPKLGVKAPLVWSKNPQSFMDDLQKGVIHYPGTVYPGQAGISYISGHSSYYVWSNGAYNHIFSRLNELNEGDEFFVTVAKGSGEKVSLRYLVTAKHEYQPDDQAQFADSVDDSLVNLSTCWPIGSTARRMVVTGKLTGV